MKVVQNITELRALVAEQKKHCSSIALVPTMGNLHEGHLSLIKKAKEDKNFVVTSIFVNPTQFGPNEDFNSYPRTLDADAEKITPYCDVIFAPTVQEMYPSGTGMIVTEMEKSKRLCGSFRAGHFDGVLTVVLKLLNICEPNSVYFGLKDYQQFVLVSDMIAKLNLDIKMVGCPLLREKDGLAMSSRNSYMDVAQRNRALALVGSLRKVKELFDGGITDVVHLKAQALQVLLPKVSPQYFEIVDPKSLEDVSVASKGCVVAVAAYCDKVRLIDNIIL